MMRQLLIWIGLVIATGFPIAVAASSPLLAWRDPIYIGAGFAGVIALGLLLIQPLLAGGYLPLNNARKAHRWIGAALVVLIIGHVGGLWITSPPDVIDALLFASATPFSAWGVVAMWAIFASAALAFLRKHLGPRRWRIGHTCLAVVIVVGSIIHALLIEGTMGTWSKPGLCLLVIAATAKVVRAKGVFTNLAKRTQR